MCPLEKIRFSTIPFTIVRRNLCPSRNRRISHSSTRLLLSQTACSHWGKDGILHNFVSFPTATYCLCPCENVVFCEVRPHHSVHHSFHTTRKYVYIEKSQGFTHFDSITIGNIVLRSWNITIKYVIVSLCPAGPKIFEHQMITEGILEVWCDFLQLLPVICCEKCRFSLFRLVFGFFLAKRNKVQTHPPPL